MQQASGRFGPHDRYAGDMIMGTGMVADAMTYPTGAARLLGKDWPEHCFYSEQTRLEFGEDEYLSGNHCKIILARRDSDPDKMRIWIDSDLGVIRKWETGRNESYKCAEFSRISLNPRLDSSVFRIPDDVLQRCRN